MNFKNISIGELIKKKVLELAIQMTRICNFFNCTEKEINDMFNADSIDTELLLKWSKLLEYDFFRLYTQHLILYAPPNNNKKNKITTSLPQFRKNIYTKDIIDFILEQINSGEMSRAEVIIQYNIPKTTLYKWISKYKT
ncbi:transposase [Chryseobacterium sp. RU33C]|nr:transposase [Chryseobacterium sp. RU33C]SIR65631.1 hypothetical protein SAMN05880573_1328 [Chryseobacterium sp. RU33C]